MSKRWTSDELDILRNHYEDLGPKEIHDRGLLPGRSWNAIRKKGRDLDLTCREFWSDAELDILRRYYTTEGGDVESRLPKRSRRACASAAQRLGLADTRHQNTIITHSDVSEIHLTDYVGNPNGVVLVDTEHLHLVEPYQWSRLDAPPHVYAYRNVGNQPQITMHVQLMKNWGLWEPDMHVDHANRNGLDNRKENLSMMGRALNQTRDLRRRSHAKYDLPRGVTKTTPGSDMHHAQIGMHGSIINLGQYEDPLEGHAAYILARQVRFVDRLDMLDNPDEIVCSRQVISTILNKIPSALDISRNEVYCRLERILDQEWGLRICEYIE